MGSNFFSKLIEFASENLRDLSVISNETTGERGERLTEKELNLVRLFGRDGRILRNLYLPKDGEVNVTSEIDLVFITQKGIFVIESKNYSGWIFGSEKDRQWTASLANGQRNRFYNPIMQNKTHIKCIRRLVGESIPIFSLIVFSKRCTLKNVTWESPNVEVINRDETYATIKGIWDQASDKVPLKQIDSLYEMLLPYTKVGEDIKERHIAVIKEKHGG